jgi:3-oxoacyl-[acyl-carrier protein] reductase
VAEVLSAEGFAVALMARTRSQLDEVAAALSGRVYVAECDVSDARAVHTAVEAVIKTFGRIDAVVHAAGMYGPIGLSHEVDVDDWRAAIEVNLCGAFYVAHAVVPYMCRARRGKLVFLAGGGAAQPLARFSAYAASKAGTVRLVDTLAAELADSNIQVNAIAPGLVDTTLQDDVLAAGERAGPVLDRIRAARATGQGAVPPLIAATLVQFLVSPQSGALTGKLLAAPYDPWRNWTPDSATKLNATPIYALRRVDPFTVAQLDS